MRYIYIAISALLVLFTDCTAEEYQYVDEGIGLVMLPVHVREGSVYSSALYGIVISEIIADGKVIQPRDSLASFEEPMAGERSALGGVLIYMMPLTQVMFALNPVGHDSWYRRYDVPLEYVKLEIRYKCRTPEGGVTAEENRVIVTRGAIRRNG